MRIKQTHWLRLWRLPPRREHSAENLTSVFENADKADDLKEVVKKQRVPVLQVAWVVSFKKPIEQPTLRKLPTN